MRAMTIVRILLAIFLPPVAVFITDGFGVSLLLNIILTLLGGIPGMVHALYVVVKHNG